MNITINNVTIACDNYTAFELGDELPRIRLYSSLFIELAGIIANSLSMTALCHMQRPLSPFHCLLFSLTMSDFCIVFTAFIGALLYLHEQNIHGSVLHLDCMCNKQLLCGIMATGTLSYVAQLLPLLMTAGIVANQYIAVKKPLHYKSWITTRRVFWYVFFSVCFTAIIYFVPIISNITHFNKDFCGSIIMIYTREMGGDVLFCWLTVAAFTLVCIFTLVIYMMLYKSTKEALSDPLRKHQRHSVSKTGSRMTVKAFNVQPDTKLNATIALLLACIVVFWLPGIVDQLLELYYGIHGGQVLTLIVNLLFLCNTICDPIIYSVRLPDIQKGYRRAWHRLKGYCKKSKMKRNIPFRNRGHENSYPI